MSNLLLEASTPPPILEREESPSNETVSLPSTSAPLERSESKERDKERKRDKGDGHSKSHKEKKKKKKKHKHKHKHKHHHGDKEKEKDKKDDRGPDASPDEASNLSPKSDDD